MTLSVGIAVFLAAAAAHAQPAPGTQPAEGPASRPAGAAGELVAKATLVVKGVYARTAPDAPWQPVKLGDTFVAGAEFRTGVGAQLVLEMGDNSVVLVKSLTQVVLDTLVRREDTVVTKLDLSQGRMRAGVTTGKFKSDFTIASPVASLSVRGTHPVDVQFADDLGFLGALGTEGIVTLRRNVAPFLPGGPGQSVLPGEQSNGNLTPAILVAAFHRLRRAADVFYQQTGNESNTSLHLAQTPVLTPRGFEGFDDPRLADPSAMGSSPGVLYNLLLMRGLLTLPTPPSPPPTGPSHGGTTPPKPDPDVYDDQPCPTDGESTRPKPDPDVY